MEGTTSLGISYLSWWYVYAYGRLFKYLRAFYIQDADVFSAKICITTIFMPWKRDLINSEGLALKEKFQVWTLNLASRFSGFVIKMMTLFSFLISLIILSAISVVLIIVWPFIPLIAIYLIISGIRLI